MAYALFLITKWIGSRVIFRDQLCRRFLRSSHAQEDVLPHRMIEPVMYDRTSSDSNDDHACGERSNLLIETY